MDTVKYHKWTKEQLIEKIIAYEKELKISGKNKKKYVHKQRPFDITKYNQRPIALKIAYLGWNYYGYAAQDGENVETIESHLFKALHTAKLIKDRESCRYNRCGRTDKGVSAFCQIVSLCVRSNLPANHEDVFTWQELMEDDNDSSNNTISLDNNVGNVVNQSEKKTEANVKQSQTEELAYCTILNRLLPPDIRIISWSPVDKNFNARFHCTYRTYKYFFPAQRLDIPLMQKAAKKLVGVHDFRNFCKIDPLYNSHYRRTVYTAEIYKMNHLEKNIKIPTSQIEPNEVFIENPDSLDDEFLKKYRSKNSTNNYNNSEENKANDIDMDTEIYDIEKSSPFEMYIFEVCGKAFLWHQVRFFMGILFLIGRHLEEPEIIDTLLDLSKHDNGKLGRPSYDLADEFPLVLVDTGYPEGTFQWRLEDYFGHDPIYNSKNFFLNVLNLWKKKQIKAAMIETLIRDVKYLRDTSSTENIKRPPRRFAIADKRLLEKMNINEEEMLKDKENENEMPLAKKIKINNDNDNNSNNSNNNININININNDNDNDSKIKISETGLLIPSKEKENDYIIKKDTIKADYIYKRKSISNNKEEQQKCEDRFNNVIQFIMKGTLCSGSKNVQEKKYVKVMDRQRCESIQCVREKFLMKQEKKRIKKENKNNLTSQDMNITKN